VKKNVFKPPEGNNQVGGPAKKKHLRSLQKVGDTGGAGLQGNWRGLNLTWTRRAKRGIGQGTYGICPNICIGGPKGGGTSGAQTKGDQKFGQGCGKTSRSEKKKMEV